MVIFLSCVYIIMGAIVSLVVAVVKGANIVNTLNNFVKSMEEAGNVWDVLDATAGLLVFGGFKPSLLYDSAVSGNPGAVYDQFLMNNPVLTQKAFASRMTARYNQIKDDPDKPVDSNEGLSSATTEVMQDTVIEMIENVNTLYVTSQIWADYAFSKVDEYPDLISKIHSIIVGPIEPEDTTENPNVVPFNSIDDVYHGYTHARSFTLQTEITTIREETFTHMESLEEILVETEQDNNGREHQYYSSRDGKEGRRSIQK